ncbi:outer membrane lipoprotein carrier protein [Pricia antarctica]|uniref:Outer membrane lipoprotein carrier protein n=1 Tax=Pricia antarctica TaxID=641691 RepID=A0A1G6WBT4_9FLAO|nr:outer membrane lipoprotein carrier protein LolA [Pricia antarctica]SDD63278.1 outer membrane lipoprotein carrier protein [Pricia antarctica]
MNDWKTSFIFANLCPYVKDLCAIFSDSFALLGASSKLMGEKRNIAVLRNSFVIAIIFLFSATLSAQTKMSTTEANALKTSVKRQADATTTITSDFTQYKHLDFLSDDIESKGKLAFKVPDLVKWEYVEPFSYSIIFKDNTLYINDDGNKSNMDVGGNKIFTQLNQLITASIRGDLFDDDQFDISYFKKDRNSLVSFTPKDAQFAEFIKTFQMIFNPAGEVIQVKMIEPSDDYTQIVFSSRKTNQPLSDADFSQ